MKPRQGPEDRNRAVDSGKGVALGAGAGMILGALFWNPGAGMVVGAAAGLAIANLVPAVRGH